MRYIKTYEDINEPMVGDWVICNDSLLDDYDKDRENWLEGMADKFIKDNVGQIIGITEVRGFNGPEYPYLVLYENVPSDIADVYFAKDLGLNKPRNSRHMRRDEILHFCKSKEDCEAFMIAKNYNL